MWYKFVHSEDITIKGDRIISAILNLNLQGQQSRPILLQSYFKMVLSAREDQDSSCTPGFKQRSKISYANTDLFVFY